jgi:hypothetical protein
MALLVSAAVITSVALYLTRSQYLTDWDSWEYASQAVNSTCSGLCLGRWWFDFFMRQAYVVGTFFGTDLLNCFTPMRLAVSLCTVVGVLVLMHWTYKITGTILAMALAGAMAIISGPLMAYGSAVMTETPAMLLVTSAYLFWENAIRRAQGQVAGGLPAQAALWALAAGLAFGIAANIREPIVFLTAWPVVSCFVDRPRGRWRLLALAVAGTLITLGIGVVMAWMIRGQDPYHFLQDYNQYMTLERSTYGWSKIMNLLYLLLHTHTAAPLVAAAGIGFVLWLLLAGGKKSPQLARLRGQGRLAALALSTVPYALMSWYNPDLSFNYRLMLPLAWVLIPAAAVLAEVVIADLFLTRPRPGLPQTSRRRKIAITCLTALAIVQAIIFGTGLLYIHLNYADCQTRLFQQLQKLPHNCAVVPGPGVPVANFLRDVGLRKEFVVIMAGFDANTDNMAARMQEQLDQGRRVFVNISELNQSRPDGCCFEFTATTQATTRFTQRPGPEPFVELLAPQ